MSVARPIRRLTSRPRRAPGLSLRGLVVLGAAAVIVVMAFVMSGTVANRLRETATEAARHHVESIVRGFIDPSVHANSFDLDAIPDPGVNEQLERLSIGSTI